MTVRFYGLAGGRVEIDVSYGYGPGDRIPVAGEMVSADGTDPRFPKGDYRVKSVRHVIGLRSHQTTCYLEPLA